MSSQFSAYSWLALLPAPACAFFTDLHNDAGGRQLSAQRIRSLEVSSLARGCHTGNFIFNVGVGKLAGLQCFFQSTSNISAASFRLCRVETCLHLSGIVIVQYGKDH